MNVKNCAALGLTCLLSVIYVVNARTNRLQKIFQYTTCGATPYLAIIDDIKHEEAINACNAIGWQLADLNDSNIAAALTAVQNSGCYPFPGIALWIRSFNGLDGCFLANADMEGAIMYNNIADCQSECAPVLCQPLYPTSVPSFLYRTSSSIVLEIISSTLSTSVDSTTTSYTYSTSVSVIPFELTITASTSTLTETYITELSSTTTTTSPSILIDSTETISYSLTETIMETLTNIFTDYTTLIESSTTQNTEQFVEISSSTVSLTETLTILTTASTTTSTTTSAIEYSTAISTIIETQISTFISLEPTVSTVTIENTETDLSISTTFTSTSTTTTSYSTNISVTIQAISSTIIETSTITATRTNTFSTSTTSSTQKTSTTTISNTLLLAETIYFADIVDTATKTSTDTEFILTTTTATVFTGKITLTTEITTVTALASCPSTKPRLCRQCGPRQFALIKDHLSYDQARCACQLIGMELARLDITNLLSASYDIFNCEGSFASAWIDSWNGSQVGDCIAVSIGLAPPGGSINQKACSVKLPVMCERRPHISRREKSCLPKSNRIPLPLGQFFNSENIFQYAAERTRPISLNNPAKTTRDSRPNKIVNQYAVCTAALSPENPFTVISDGVFANDTANACGSIGLNVADISDANQGFAAEALSICGSGVGWIRSFNGIGAPNCLQIIASNTEICQLEFLYGNICSQELQNVLCQASDPISTSFGTAIPSFSTVYTGTMESTVVTILSQKTTEIVIDTSVSLTTLTSIVIETAFEYPVQVIVV